jgi:hypothetical protein
MLTDGAAEQVKPVLHAQDKIGLAGAVPLSVGL